MNTLYNWLLFGHILAAMVWIGGWTLLNLTATLILRREPDPALAARFLRSLRLVGPLLLGPAFGLLLGLGIWLVIDSPAWSMDEGWLQLAFALLVATALVGGLFQARVASAAERAARAGDDDASLRGLRRWTWGARLILVLLVIATWDMVFKPNL
jgi:uncharacterized membrane protein